MLHVNEIEIELTASIRNKIRNYAASGGGIYRMNTQGATYYSFTPFKDDKGKIDFAGGWDWRNTLPNNFSYVYDIANNRFIEMDKIQTLKDTGKL